ncbi:cupin domain-containing protein [Aestuariirhabdus sp. Z084]|uniref:cupin domain-containing protein n=1 Tax=Aestuariirhabdus haliotis TaxID=2918751 RepID=UPI0020C02AD7|nr:cupin domain-containing protein [Aestuariirhabdus haliotis]MCL6414336.1 cupin domain-containing protein [Aestuariirhabdus haliotis]
MDVGGRLKAIRKQHGLSQRELAKRVGVTNSTISMIEKNSVSPSISSLKKVLGGIPMSLVEFFSMEAGEEQQQKFVYRSDELLNVGMNDVQLHLVGKARNDRAMAFMVETMAPGTSTGSDMLIHEGQEAGVVIEGKLELKVGTEVAILEEGDSYYFDSTQPHRFSNPFDETLRLVSCTTPANF